MQLHHVGIATPNAAALVARADELFDSDVVHEEALPERNLRVVFLGDGPELELLEPTGEGPVRRFLDREGPGVHHLAFAVADVDAALDRARDRGAPLVDEEPRPGARGHRVAFLHPDAFGGVLVELVEIGEE